MMQEALVEADRQNIKLENVIEEKNANIAHMKDQINWQVAAYEQLQEKLRVDTQNFQVLYFVPH